MEPNTPLHPYLEHFSAFWLVAIGAFTMASAWVTTVLVTRETAKKVKAQDALFADHEARIKHMELNCVLSSSCRSNTAGCKDDREAIAASTNERLEALTINTSDRLDKIMDMFARLEERRNERWLEFEHRRETSKADLQKTLTDMTKQLACLQGALSERDKRFRKTNGGLD